MADVHPGSAVGDVVEEFKKLPTWGKALTVGAVGIAAYMGYQAYKSNASTATPSLQTPDTSGGGTQSPFGNVNGVPLIPNTVNPVYGPNGDLTAYQQQAAPTPTPSQGPGSPAPNAGTNLPGSFFFGKTGVEHYIANGQQTLSQIASSLGLKSYNSLYAIPENQGSIGKLNSVSAMTYKPTSGFVLALPTGTIQKQPGINVANVPHTPASVPTNAQ